MEVVNSSNIDNWASHFTPHLLSNAYKMLSMGKLRKYLRCPYGHHTWAKRSFIWRKTERVGTNNPPTTLQEIWARGDMIETYKIIKGK